MMNTSRHLATAIAAGFFALGAQATPVTYDFTLQATGIGNLVPVFGISSLPAGPFSGSFTFDGPLTPSQTFVPVTLTAFTATVGNFTWTLSDVTSSLFSTDAAGDIDPAKLLIEAAHGPSGSAQQTLNLYSGVYTNLGWYAIDPAPSSNPYCSFASFNPPLTGPNGGSCIGGGTATQTITVVERQEAPEPATLLLTALGLFGLAARRR